MAWRVEVTDVTGTDTEGNDLTVSGRCAVHCRYYDSAAPSTTLFEQSFDFGAGISAATILERVKEAGRRVRDARARVTELSASEGRNFAID